MKSQEEIIKRIGVLTATIGRLTDELYDMALQNKQRKCLWAISNISKTMIRAYNELIILEWVLDEKRD